MESRWILTILTVVSVQCARPPDCHSDGCQALVASESAVGEYPYNVSLGNNIIVNIQNNEFMLNCQEQDVELATLPRYDSPATFSRVTLRACGTKSGPSALLSHCGLHTTRLELTGWRGDLNEAAFEGLAVASLRINRLSTWTVHAAGLRLVSGLTVLSLEGLRLEDTSLGVYLERLELRRVVGADLLVVPAELRVLAVDGIPKCPSLAAAYKLRVLSVGPNVHVPIERMPMSASSLEKLTLERWGSGSVGWDPANVTLSEWAPELRELKLSGGRTPALHGLRLVNLRLSDQRMTELPDTVLSQMDLRELDLSRNRLVVVPALHLPQLTTLQLSFNPIEIIPDLSGCPLLSDLQLRGTHVVSFSPSEHLPQALRVLDMYSTPLSGGPRPPSRVRVVLPDELCERPRLSASLRAAYCSERPCSHRFRTDNYTELVCDRWPAPDEWIQTDVSLRVENAGLKELPWEMSVWVREVHVRGNVLVSLPSSWRSLRVVDARDNPLGEGALDALLAVDVARVTCRCDGLLAALSASPHVYCGEGEGESTAGEAWRRCNARGPLVGAVAAAMALLTVATSVALYYKYRSELKRMLWRRWGGGSRSFQLDVAVVGSGQEAEEVVRMARAHNLRAETTTYTLQVGQFGPAGAGAVLRAAATHVLLDQQHHDAQVSLALCSRSTRYRVVRVMYGDSNAPSRSSRDCTYLCRDDPHFWDKLFKACSPHNHKPPKQTNVTEKY